VKTEFVKPSFEGTRFDQHTLPLEFAKDLVAYEELVVALAKHLYFQAHPDRQRVPRGFDKDFSLHFQQIDEGSARPIIAMVTAAALTLSTLNTTYFEKARDVIAECIQAQDTGQPLPPTFPKELLDYFNVFGRSLREGERIVLSTPNSGAAILTPAGRKALVLGAHASYARELDVTGSIREIDWEKKTFRLKIDDGGTVSVPLSEKFDDEIRKAGGKLLWRATIKGVGEFDSFDGLQRLTEIHSMLVLPNYCVVSQVDELAALTNGWCHEQSKAPNSALLDWAVSKFEATYPAELGLLMIGASPEGNLFIEWILNQWRISAEIIYPSFKCEFQAVNLNDRECVDSTFDLALDSGWDDFYSAVRRYV
jgi:hypothetical protein